MCAGSECETSALRACKIELARLQSAEVRTGTRSNVEAGESWHEPRYYIFSNVAPRKVPPLSSHAAAVESSVPPFEPDRRFSLSYEDQRRGA